MALNNYLLLSTNKLDLGSKKRRLHWDSAPSSGRAGALEGVGGGVNSSPSGLGLGFDLDLLLWSGSTRPEASQARCLGGFGLYSMCQIFSLHFRIAEKMQW